MSRKVRPTIVASQEDAKDIAASDSGDTIESQAELSFRPRLRPPMALLIALDDGVRDGEVFRLRGDATTLGREGCDVTIPHDGLISGRHLEIVRVRGASGFRWHLKDLKSRNGSFFRIKQFRVRTGFELLLGSYRYRLHLSTEPEISETEEQSGTQAWSAVTPDNLKSLTPHLVQLDGEIEIARFELSSDVLLGSGPAPGGIRVDDPLLSRSHVRLFQDVTGKWKAEDQASRNGTWIRGEHSIVTKACQFQLGEQRFVFKVL